MFYLFICCNSHYIRIGKFQTFEMADEEARYHSANCGSSILFEVWHKRACLKRYVDECL